MSYTEGTRALKVVEICKIIETCKLAGVSEFAYAGLSFKFHSLGQASVTEPSKVVSPSEASHPEIPNNPIAVLMNEQTLEDAEEAQIMIDDPFAYERSQIMKDIERNRVHDG